jgi:CBS domain-containing protein
MIDRMPEPVESLLARLPGCARLSPEALAALAAAAWTETFPAGIRLVTEGEPLPDWYGLVQAGAVQVSRLDVETDETLDYVTAGDVLDLGTPGLPAACSASTAEPTRCVFVPQSVVARHRGSLAAAFTVPYRGDLALFVRRVADLVRRAPVTSAASAAVADAARLMTERGVGSVIVVEGDGTPTGIVTDRDLRAKIVAAGLPSSTRLGEIMSSPLVSTELDRLAFDALLEMTRRGIHHLAVMDAGRLHGVVSSHDIVVLHGAHPVALVRQIENATSIDGLAAVAPGLQDVVKWLAGQGVSASDIGRIVAELNDRLVRRLLDLTTWALAAEGHGGPPVRYAWLVAGSEGRREQTLKTDQDNGLLYEDPAPDLRAAAATYFGKLAAAMGDALARLGFPPCAGGFMASNPRWCQPESVWREYFAGWMETPQPEPVLQASIFFDLRPVGGDEALGGALCDWVCDRAPSRTLFLRHMAKAALERHVPLGLFGGFVVERSGVHKHRLDLKARGMFPVTQAVRVYALSRGLRETSTVDRLRAVGRLGLLGLTQVEELRDAFEVIARLRLGRQLDCLEAGRTPDNFIDPDALRTADRVLLKQAFKTVAWLQREVEGRFMTGLVA